MAWVGYVLTSVPSGSLPPQQLVVQVVQGVSVAQDWRTVRVIWRTIHQQPSV